MLEKGKIVTCGEKKEEKFIKYLNLFEDYTCELPLQLDNNNE